MAMRLERIAVSSGSSRTDRTRGIKPHKGVSRPTLWERADAVLERQCAAPKLSAPSPASSLLFTCALVESSDLCCVELSQWRVPPRGPLIDSWTTTRAACPSYIVPTELVVRVSCGAGRNDVRHNNERKAHSATE